jgi:uncharacterized membrane protein YeaQ/YmgE (transglycosylase-associated protein family)
MVNLMMWLIVAGIIGWVASMIMRTDAQQGPRHSIVVGDDSASSIDSMRRVRVVETVC